MPRKKDLMMLITYAAILTLAIVKADVLWSAVSLAVRSSRPLLIGLIIAFVLDRPCSFFCRRYRRNLGVRFQGLARPLAVLTAYLVLLSAVVVLFSLLLPQLAMSLQALLEGLSGYMANLQALMDRLAQRLDWAPAILDLSGLSSGLEGLLGSLLGRFTDTAGQVMVLTEGLFSLLVTTVIALVFSIYLLAGKESLLSQGRRLVEAYLPHPIACRLIRVTHISSEICSGFVAGQLAEACILGVLCALGTAFIQADFALLIGTIIGLSALIPVAGAYIGALLSAFLLLMVSPVRAVIFLIFLAVLQQIEGSVIYPRVVGASIGLPGIWVLAAVTVGGGLFGLAGLLLSVPAASVAYTLLRLDVRRRLEDEAGQ